MASGSEHILTASLVRRRGIGGMVALAMILVWIVAWQLQPNGASFGTHRQMKLPPCGMLMETGYPCPGCGVTTSFTASVHGQWALAARSQIFGLVVYWGTILLAGAGAHQAWTGRASLARLRLISQWRWWVVSAVWMLLIGWGVKLWLGVGEGLYPVGR